MNIDYFLDLRPVEARACPEYKNIPHGAVNLSTTELSTPW
jgi:hypothetical protein